MVGAWFDPRNTATTRPRLTCAVVLLVTGIMLYGNWITQKGGVLDDVILDEQNPYLLSDRHVRQKREEGFHGQEHIAFLIKFPAGIRSKDDLLRIHLFSKTLRQQFGPAVMSLSEIADYQDTGEELRNVPYIPEQFAADFDIEEWKRQVARDPMVYGVFVGREFDWATVVRYLPPGYDEITEFRRTVEFLEGRRIPWWEWLWKTSVEAPEGIGVGGGVVVRGVIDQGVNVDNAILVGFGIALALPLFAWSLGSLREALIGIIGVVALGFLWTRGSIGLLQLAGFDVRERVYTLLAYTNCIVQGVSFVLHKFEALNQVMAKPDRPASPAQCWEQARSNDLLIGATALIATFGFSTLYVFPVLPIRELGLFSAMAVAYQTFLILVFVPAIHLLTSRPATLSVSPPTKTALLFRRLLDSMVEACSALVTRLAPRPTALIALGVTTLLLVAAMALVWPGGMLVIKTVPLAFVRGTIIEETALFMDKPGRPGRDYMELFVEPAGNSRDIYEPEFLHALWIYQEAIKSRAGVREVGSILNQVHRISEESFHKPLPSSRQEARNGFALIESDLNTSIARQLFHSSGIRLTTYFVGEDSLIAAAFLEQVLAIGKEFPQLRVWSFGKESLYPQMDQYIRQGKPLNMVSSQAIVVLLCCLGVWMKNRALGARRGPRLSPLGGGMTMSVPFLLGCAVMVYLMVGFAVPLDAATAAITSLAINASVDFSIYFTDAYQEGLAASGKHRTAVVHAMHSKGRVVLEDMLLNSVCFLPLVTSRFEVVQEVGWILVVVLVGCAAGTVLLMPALFHLSLREGTP